MDAISPSPNRAKEPGDGLSLPPGATVFVIEANDRDREALAKRVVAMGFAVETFRSAENFWTSVGRRRPGCVVFDGRTTIQGTRLADRLAETTPIPPLVYVSDETDAVTVARLVRDGGAEFLSKPSYGETELWEALQRGLALDAQRRCEHAAEELRRRRVESLSAIDKRILLALLDGLNNPRIAAMLGVTRSAVEGRRSRMMRKLGVTNVAALVRFAVESQRELGAET